MRHMPLTLKLGLLVLLYFCVLPFNILTQPASAQTDAPLSVAKQEDVNSTTIQSRFCLSAGYRTDNLTWNIAGTPQGRDPNVLSELSWSGVASFQLKLANTTVIKDWVYLRAQLDYGVVITGDNQDSDYNGDNRTLEFSRSVNGVDGNNVWDGSMGIGPRFSFLDATVALCPLLGYAIAEQDFNIVDGYQVLTAPPATGPTGPIDGLDSRYQTRWHGPWIGLDVLLSMPVKKGVLRQVDVMFCAEYHWVDYSADANWNLRSNLQHPVSFSHDADGHGMAIGTTLLFQTRNRWGIAVGMNMREMTTDPGLDRVFLANGDVSDTRLNEVSWRAFTFEAGLSYQF